MLYGNDRQLVRRKHVSVIARSFFDVLWRWNRLSCAASRSRSYAKVVDSALRHQCTPLPLPNQRTLLPNVLLAAAQRRSKSFMPLHALETWKDHIKEVKESVERPPNELPASGSTNITNEPSSSAAEKETHLTRPKQADDSPISWKLRGIMRGQPASVVVVTTTSTLTQPKHDSNNYRSLQASRESDRGMTLSSFTTLTLSPEPIVTFNIRYPSSTLEAIQSTKQFLVHLLNANQVGARISSLFTMGIAKDTFAEGVNSGLFTLKSEAGPGPVRGDTSETLPRLCGKGIGNVLRCELLSSQLGAAMIPSHNASNDGWTIPRAPAGLIAVGDHVLVLARVVEILDRSQNDTQHDPSYGLSYVDGQYRYVGTSIISQNASKKPF